jgi:ATP-dependent helicase/nuclease subunit B
MELIGRIDRVDHLRLPTYPHTDYLRVIDYKSSAKKLNLFEVQMGLSLQMLAYLDVVLTHAKTWLGHEALPAAALYFHVHDPIILSKNLISKNEADRLIRMKFKTKGLVTADPELIGYMDKQFTESLGASELIPAKLKKDGNFYAHSSVLTHQQWTTLRQHVRQQIKTVGSKILSGHVEIEPYRMGKQTACQYCSFKPVCHYDPLFEGNVMNVWQQKNKKQAWLEIEQNVSQHPQ